MATETWSPTQQSWKQQDLARNLVTESDIGWNHATLYFPGVSSCTAVAMWVDNITVLGAHFDKILTANDVDTMLNEMLTKINGLAIGPLFVFGALSYPGGPQSFVNAPNFEGNQFALTVTRLFKPKLVYIYDQYDHKSPSNRQPAKHYRAVSKPNEVMTLDYFDVPYNTSSLDKRGAPWAKVPVSPLRELY